MVDIVDNMAMVDSKDTVTMMEKMNQVGIDQTSLMGLIWPQLAQIALYWPRLTPIGPDWF